jgi:hypothetical protein
MEYDFKLLEELITVTGAVLTSVLIPAIGWVWLKIVKPIVSILKTQEAVNRSIEELKDEISTHSGKTIKDTLGHVKEACGRIEDRQKVIVQRTKAALHYSGVALFETDKRGRLVWSNNLFGELIREHNALLEGYDWLSLIKDDEQEETLDQFRSCLSMNRRFVKQTELDDGRPIRMVGYPLKISDDQHDGFLVSISHILQ